MFSAGSFPSFQFYPFTIFLSHMMRGVWTVRASSHAASLSVGGLIQWSTTHVSVVPVRDVSDGRLFGIKDSHTFSLQFDDIPDTDCKSGLSSSQGHHLIAWPQQFRLCAHSTPLPNPVYPGLRGSRSWNKYHEWDGKDWWFIKYLWPSKAQYIFDIISIILLYSSTLFR